MALLVFGCGEKSTPITSAIKENVIECTGYLLSESSNDGRVSSPEEGKVVWVTSKTVTGNGSLLAQIENSDIVIMQKEYLDAKNTYDYCREEYTRQGELTVENATTIRKMQAAKKDYQAAEINLRALEMQLRLKGLDPVKIKPEALEKAIPVYSSIKGNIIRHYVKPGDFVSAGDPLFEISSNESWLIQFEIPEKDYFRISSGMKADCIAACDSLTVFKATVRNMNGTVDPKTKMATGFAEIKGEPPFMIQGMSVRATIHLNSR